jgi:SAM-dependent methyltransferase
MTTANAAPPPASDSAFEATPDPALDPAGDHAVDEAAIEEFAMRILELCTGGLTTYMIEIGRRTGLFDAAMQGPATSEGLAARAGLDERYVREWLGAMATSGIFDHDATSATFTLPPAHAVCLTGSGVENLAPVAYFTTVLGAHVPAVSTAFREGGGVPFDAYLPELHDVMDALWKPIYDHLLVDAILPLAPGLVDRLRAGAHVADVACGSGNGLSVLAAEFPTSTFVGYDLDRSAIERGRAEAARQGLTNLTFVTCDAAELATDEPFDAVLVFNAIHDQVAPDAVLERIHAALVPGGVFLMNEPRVSSNLEDNIGNPLAPLTYAVSTLHCLTVSLAHGGAGLGTAWGEQVARQMLADAGFGDVDVHDAPGDPGNAVFVSVR